MKVSGIECSNCKDQIWSRNVHDMRYCKCYKTYVDGGRFYLHAGWDNDIEPPKVIEIELTNEENK